MVDITRKTIWRNTKLYIGIPYLVFAMAGCAYTPQLDPRFEQEYAAMDVMVPACFEAGLSITYSEHKLYTLYSGVWKQDQPLTAFYYDRVAVVEDWVANASQSDLEAPCAQARGEKASTINMWTHGLYPYRPGNTFYVPKSRRGESGAAASPGYSRPQSVDVFIH